MKLIIFVVQTVLNFGIVINGNAPVGVGVIESVGVGDKDVVGVGV